MILSQTALNVPSSAETHWVVLSEYAALLNGNPKIQKVIPFDRRLGGVRGWISLNRQLASEGYDEVLDLHSTLRTRLARCVFWWFCFIGGRPFPRWAKISKSKFRRFGYVSFKSLWPQFLFPRPLRREFLGCAARSGLSSQSDSYPVQDLRYLVTRIGRDSPPKRFGVMPGSAWPGKKWPTESFLRLLKLLRDSKSEWIPVLFGDPSESSVQNLAEHLRRESIPFDSAIGKKPFTELAEEISGTQFLISNDTGIAHLAEGLGVPVLVLYGPTTPEFGFGPALARSKTVGAELWCRPCGKDGTGCFRLGKNRFACMQKLNPGDVLVLALKLMNDLEVEAARK